jgi:hypothetical protein
MTFMEQVAKELTGKLVRVRLETHSHGLYLLEEVGEDYLKLTQDDGTEAGRCTTFVRPEAVMEISNVTNWLGITTNFFDRILKTGEIQQTQEAENL